MAGDQPILAQGGMTLRELMKKLDLSYDTAGKGIRRLKKQGLIRQIGVRPDQHRCPVYEVVKPRRG
jgi:DNA-binding Lrp family transcriptional regulator